MRALADDAVAVGLLRLSAASDAGRVRAQLAAVPTPSVRPWVFVRRVRVRATPGRLGLAMRDTLEALARDSPSERMVFTTFGAMAATLGRDAVAAQIGARWWWRALGIPTMPGAAVASLLRAEPLRVWEALTAWREAGLLPVLWPAMTDDAVASVVADVARVTGFAPPAPESVRAVEVSARADVDGGAYASAVAQAAAFWADALPPHRPALAEAALFLSLLRWQSAALSHPRARTTTAAAMWAALRSAGRAPDAAATAAPLRGEPAGPAGQDGTDRGIAAEPAGALEPTLVPDVTEAALAEAPTAEEPIRTLFGGTLFLLNALERLGIRRRLVEWPGDAPPNGFQLLLGLALRGGLPPEDPLAAFLAEEAAHPLPIPRNGRGEADLPSRSEAGGGFDALYAELRALYPAEPDDPPGLFFLWQPAALFVAPMHFDLHFAAAAISLRIRRAALDRDPGWVPWLGRVVRFHYPAIPTRWARPR